ncbi:MAG: beta-lactamase family protein [Candidatus Cloacimonetes bacterium]|nr:beta-lactamase family protein [Candidatus Cloacimonadota bacterium]
MSKLSDYINFIKDMPLQFEPGERMIHSNTSFEVLGAIIEVVSGMDYYDYVREYIYQPCKMINSDSFTKLENIENRATGYTNIGDPSSENYEKDNTLSPPLKGTPAGGGFSTAEDLLKFVLALTSNEILSSKYTDFLLNRFEGEKDEPYPYNGIAKWLGASAGVNAFLGIDWENQYTYIILSNYDHPVAIDIGDKIIEMMKLNKK